MQFWPLAIPGMSQVRTAAFRDERGAFSRLWCHEDFAAAGVSFSPIQASLSENPRKGTLRGMHWQEEPFGETKFVMVLRGRIFDAVVDLRRGSSGFGRHAGLELGPGEGLLIPPGCAHGFLTLSEDVLLLYMMDAAYEPSAARGLRYDDPDVAIAWPRAPEVVGARDLTWPALRDLG